jgi:hypothetical protein
MPILATEARIAEISNELDTANAVNCNGLFLMLVSYIESMQKEVLNYYLKHQPEKLPANSIEVDKSVLVDGEDFYLLERIISEHIEKMPYWRLSKLFFEVLRIKKPDNHKTIQNIKQRRNELIHNNLKIDFKRKEVKHDSVEPKFLSECIAEYIAYLDSLKDEISRVYYRFSKINAIKNLWFYTFKTPLCGVFESYWHIDIENDVVFGCKRPDIEHGLSSGEKFMLDIWRSQVCGGEVDFLNMISLDCHFQRCLYLFLKLSNDMFLYDARKITSGSMTRIVPQRS